MPLYQVRMHNGGVKLIKYMVLIIMGVSSAASMAGTAQAVPAAYACPPGRMLCIAGISPAQGQPGRPVHLHGRFGTNYRALKLMMYRNGRSVEMQVQHWDQRNATAVVPHNARYGTYFVYIGNSVLAGFGNITPLPGSHGVVSNSVHFTVPNPALEHLHIKRDRKSVV